MLTIYFGDGTSQVLRNFGNSFYEEIHKLGKFGMYKLLKEIANDIAKGYPHTIKWEELN